MKDEKGRINDGVIEKRKCPNCGSTSVSKRLRRYAPTRREVASGRKQPTSFYCRKCKFKF